MTSFPARLAAPVLIGALIAPFLLGQDVLGWSLLWGGAAVGFIVWRNALARTERLLDGLRLVWMELPGAIQYEGRIEVYDGTHPLTVEMGRDKSMLIASLTVAIGDSPVTFRLWPDHTESVRKPPTVSASVAAVLERSAILEQLLAGKFHVQTNHEEQLQRMLDTETMGVLFDMLDREGESLAGLTYDGSELTVHLIGPVVANPTRAAAIARPLWQAFIR